MIHLLIKLVHIMTLKLKMFTLAFVLIFILFLCFPCFLPIKGKSCPYPLGMGPQGNQRQKLIYKLKIRIKTQNLYLRYKSKGKRKKFNLFKYYLGLSRGLKALRFSYKKVSNLKIWLIS